MIKRLIKRWKAVKALLTSEEFFLAVANPKTNKYGDKYYVMKYDYMKNTDRELFYGFVHDHIENNLRPITGKFICVRTYSNEQENVFVMKGQYVNLKDGYMTAISDGCTFQHKIPNEEIYSHFKYEGKE